MPLISEATNPSDTAAAVKSEPAAVDEPELEGVGEQFTEIIAEVIYYSLLTILSTRLLIYYYCI